MEFQSRRERLLSTLRDGRVHGFLVTGLPNVRYLSGFTGSNGALLLSKDRALLFTDPRYETQAPLESDCEVKIARKSLLVEVGGWTKRLRLKSVGFEKNRLSFDEYEQLRQQLPAIRLRPFSSAVESLRMVKSPAEIDLIRRSVELNSQALGNALRRFKLGISEVELAAEIEYQMRKLGAERTAFDTIVASGTRSALPHAHPTNEAVRSNELLLFDMGASVAGYASDMTRTYAVGRISPKKRRMYRAVLESQLAAVDSIKPGVSCHEVDKVARDVLRRFGLEQAFIHSTGHGLGLEIHERPRVGRKEKTKLEAGMVITIEPGVYQKEIGGIRIEDTAVVTSHACQILTPTGKELISL